MPPTEPRSPGAAAPPRVPLAERIEPVAERVEQVAPGAGELATELMARLRTPGVVAAVIVGAVTTLGCLVFALLIALIVPEKNSLIGGPGEDVSTVLETLRDTVGMTGAHFSFGGDGGASSAILPVTFVLLPLVVSFLAAERVADGLHDLPPRERGLWTALGGGLVCALLMVILGLIANGQSDEGSAKIGSVFLASFTVAAVGAAAGSLRVARRTNGATATTSLPEAARPWIFTLTFPLRGLAGLLAVALVLTVLHTEVQTLRGQQTARNGALAGEFPGASGRSTIGAAVENLIYAPNFAFTTAANALLAQSEPVPGLIVSDKGAPKLLDKLRKNHKPRIFALNGPLPVYVFLPELLILLGAALVAGLYSGFATARQAGAATPLLAAGFGALTGVVWAITMGVLRQFAGTNLIAGIFAGIPVGASLFGMTILVGAVTGAFGGLLAQRPTAGRA